MDGNGGIDNSWGANLLPVLMMVDPSLSAQLDAQIRDGEWTTMTYVLGFDDSAGNETSATGLTGVELLGSKYPGGPPPFDTSTNWPVAPASVMGCAYPAGCAPGTDPIENALTKFTGSFQSKGTFVSGQPQLFMLPLAVGGLILTLNIHGYLTFDHYFPGAVTNGTLAGAILASDLADQLAQPMMPSLCQGTAYQSVIMQIEQMADIVLDGWARVEPRRHPLQRHLHRPGLQRRRDRAPDRHRPAHRAEPRRLPRRRLRLPACRHRTAICRQPCRPQLPCR